MELWTVALTLTVVGLGTYLLLCREEDRAVRERLAALERQVRRLTNSVYAGGTGTSEAAQPGEFAARNREPVAAPLPAREATLPKGPVGGPAEPRGAAIGLADAASATPTLRCPDPGVTAPQAARSDRTDSPRAGAGPSGMTLEERIGGQWLNWVGAVTLAVTVALFLKWAYDSGWLAPLLHLPHMAYLCLGWSTGAALLAGGELLRKKLPLYAQGLIGSGIAALYLTTYAGHALYRILSPEAAAVGLAIVGEVALGEALLHESAAIGWIGVALAYGSPLVLGEGRGTPGPLLLFLTSLNVSILGISLWRPWKGFREAAFAATVFHLVAWCAVHSVTPYRDQAAFFVGTNWAIFMGALLTGTMALRREPEGGELGIAVLNPLLTAAALFTLLAASRAHWLGAGAAGFALVYWLLARAIRARRDVGDLLEPVLFTAAALFALVAVPLQFHGTPITAAWAAMGAVLTWAGHRSRARRTLAWGAAALGLAVGRLALVDAIGTAGAMTAFVQTRGYGFFCVILALCLAAGLAGREWLASERQDEDAAWRGAGCVLVAAGLLEWWLGLDAPSVWYPIGWTATAAAVLAWGWMLRSAHWRAAGACAAVLPVGWSILERLGPVTASAASTPGRIAVLALCLASAWVYERSGGAPEPEAGWMVPCWAAAAAGTVLAWTGTELGPGWLPASWAIVSVLLLGAGAVTRRQALRMLGLAVCCALTAELLTRELVLVSPRPVLLHSRTTAALASLGTWIAASVLLARSHEPEERRMAPYLVLAGNLTALGWLSLEAMDLGARVGTGTWSREASQFGLSAVWVAYAAVAILVGFKQRLPAARWGGIALLGASIAKVYCFDLGFLPLGYRVLSFLVLALVLLGVSYLYQRPAAVRR